MELILCLLLFAVFVYLKSPGFKGRVGEGFVNLASSLGLDSNIYHTIHDVTLPTQTGSTQIDHIIVSPFGVFVVETKNMKGWIFGSERQRQWTQIIYKSKNSFQNPLRQNYKHVKTLQELLALQNHQLFSVVVFAGECKFKTDMPENVMKLGRFTRYIKSKTVRVLDDLTVNEIVDRIERGRLEKSFKTKRKHISDLRNASDSADPIAENLCPRCGSQMVLRTAKKGRNAGSQFWGCSQFPKCRSTMKIAS